MLAALLNRRIFAAHRQIHVLGEAFLRPDVVHLQGLACGPAQLGCDLLADLHAFGSQVPQCLSGFTAVDKLGVERLADGLKLVRNRRGRLEQFLVNAESVQLPLSILSLGFRRRGLGETQTLVGCR